ncbi:MAG: MFS transporter [Dehalococcoidia bacterium]|nr:MFS transporter [Dehalococcoidia bacterium]
MQGPVEKGSTGGLFHLPTAWTVTVAAAILLVFAGANTYVFGIFFKPISAEFGWSRSVVSGAFAVRFLVMAAFVAPIGYWSDRHGSRRVVIGCFMLLGASFMLLAKVSELWQLYLVQGLLMGIGTAGPFVCLIATVGKWHDRRRGLALSIAAMGVGVSSVIFPPIAAALVQRVGWPATTAILGALILAVCIPIAMLVKDPQVRTLGKGLPSGIAQGRADPFYAWKMLPRYLRDKTLLSIFIMFFLSHTAIQMVVGHFVNFATDAGISAVMAASMMSAMGIANIAGRLGIGSLSDKFGVRRDLVGCLAAIAASLILFISQPSPTVLWIAIVVFGLGFGGLIPLIPALVADTFGTAKMATLTGTVLTGTYLGGALGPWMGGFLFDVSRSYLWAFGFAAAATCVSLLLSLRLRPVEEVRSG